MTTLKDYLGSITSSINQARALADIESAKIAQAYVNDDLLRNFSVPRFRAQDIELTIPVAIENLQKSQDTDYQPIDNKSFNSHTYNVLKDVVKVSAFDRKTSDILRMHIAKQTDILEKELKFNPEDSEAIDRFSVNVFTGLKDIHLSNDKAMQKIIEEQGLVKDELESFVRERLVDRLKPQIKSPIESNVIENTNIIVESSKLREVKPENLIMIKVKLVEEGMEWQTMQDDDGNNYTKLVPE